MLLKSVKFQKDNIDIKNRKFSGYASTWDLDQGGDIITKGAFKKTLNERSDKVKVLWQHDMGQPIGKPLSMREDTKGLFVEAALSNTTLGNDAIVLLDDGVIDTMSIGFSIPEGKSAFDSKGHRTISEVKLFEFSLVTFPMNEKAVITGVKNMRDAIAYGQLNERDLKEATELLKDISTLLSNSKPQIKHLPVDNQPSELEQLSIALKQLQNSIN